MSLLPEGATFCGQCLDVVDRCGPHTGSLMGLLCLALCKPYLMLIAAANTFVDVLFWLPPLFWWIFIPWISYRFFVWQRDSYRAFLDLGRGGTPSTRAGWLRVKSLKFFANVKVLKPPHVEPFRDPYRGILEYFPRRRGVRPTVRGVAPQRQINQKAPMSTYDQLVDLLQQFAAADATLLKVEPSFLEGHGLALLKQNPDEQPLGSNARGQSGEWGFEIAHPHRVDGSVHVVLHPEDVRTIIESGWGERHPLATDVWYWRWYYHYLKRARKPVPECLVMLYAPRNAEETYLVAKVLQAAIWEVTGRLVGQDLVDQHKPPEASGGAASAN